MYIGRTRITRICAVLSLVLLFSGACIFSPTKDKPVSGPGGKVEIPTTPEKVLNNLKLAFDDENIEYYRNCLNDNYFYVSRSEVDTLDIRWSKSEDVQIVEKVMKGSSKFVFNAVQNAQIEEYGKNCPNIPVGATVVDEHPNEMWLVINYTVDMEIFTKSFGDINVHQFMEFKFVKDAEGLYSIIQWNDLTNQ
jgi:hypothetical protein